MVAAPAARAQTRGDALARDAAGRFWVVAHDLVGGAPANVRLERYDPSGVFQSSAAIPGANGKGGASLAFDPSGRVYVAGGATAGAANALALWRFSAGGPVFQGSATYASASGDVVVGRLTVDASTGVWVPAALPLSGGGDQYALFKFAANGTLLTGFPKTYQNGGGLDGGLASAVDSSGFLWSAGASSNPATGKLDLALWKHDSAGNLQAGFPVFWPGAFVSIQDVGLALAFSTATASVWVAARKSFASCAAPEFVLLRYALSGTPVSSAAWHDAAGQGAAGLGLAVDGSGNVWASGLAAGATVLWEYAPGGALVSGYPLAAAGPLSFEPRALALDSSGAPWVLAGEQPTLFSPGGSAAGAAGPPACALSGAQVSGVVTYAAGFSAGQTLTFAVSTTAFQQGPPSTFTFAVGAGTSFAYALSLPAPATYEIAAALTSGSLDQMTPGTPIGIYADYAPVAVTTAGAVSGVSFGVAPDTTPPTSAVTSLSAGATIAALASISGTAADDVGVSRLSLAVHDLTLDLWWQPGSSSWVATTTVPYYFRMNPALSGNPDRETWVQDLTSGFGGLSADLASGHRYAFTSSAVDLVHNVEVAPAAVAVVWGGPTGAGLLPGAPTGLSGAALGVSSLAWTWSAVAGATRYDVYAGTSALLGSTTQAAFAQVGLSTDAAAAVCVSAVNTYGASAQSCAAPVYTLAAVPGAPYFTAVGSATLALAWDAAGNPSGAVYQVFLSTDGVTLVSSLSTNQTGAFFSGLTAQTTYFAIARALNASGAPSGFSAAGSTRTLAAPPLAPVNVVAVADQLNRRVLVSWQAASGTPAASYQLWRGVVPDTSTFGLVASTAAASFADRPSASATDYYQVVAVDADGLTSPRSGVAFAALDLFPPSTVTDLRLRAVRAAQGQVDLAWTAPADDLSGVAAYYLLASTSAAFAGSVSTTAISALAPGTTVVYTVNVDTTQAYYFAVRSIDGAGNLSAASNAVLLDLVPPVIASVDLAGGLTISRPRYVNVAATDNVAVASVAVAVDGVVTSSAASSPVFWDTRLTADGPHTVTILAYDAFGNSASTTRAETVNYAPPSPPVVASPAPNFATKVATINVTGTAEPGVSVQVMANNVDLDTAAVVGGVWQVLPERLPTQGPVSLTAVAYEPRGFSGPSAAVSGYYSMGAPLPPQLPVGAPGPNGLAVVNWSAPATGAAPAYYRVYRSTNDALLVPGGPAPSPSLLVADKLTALSYDDAPAVDDLYFYGVTALDPAGNESRLSDVVYVLTDRVPPTAQVVLSTRPPLGVKSYPVQFQLSEVLSAAPIFTFTPPGGQPIALNASAITATLWQSTATIAPAMSSGTATFAFQGTDLAGNVGTAISSATVVIRTVGPAGAVALAKTSPLSVGALGVALTLDEPAVGAPTLNLTPAGGIPIPVALSAAAPFDGTSWSGSVVVTTTTGDGIAAFAFSAVDALGNVNSALFSGTTFFTIKTVPPGAPLAVRANSLPANQVLITWSAPFGERPADYRIFRDGVGLSTQVAPAADGSGSYLDTTTQGLHSYQVSSLDLAGNESAPTDPTALARATPPAPPANSTATINGFGQIQVSWQAGSTDTARFALYRATFSAASVAGLPRLSPNAVSPFLDSPPVDAVYRYYVTALDSVGNESAPAPELDVVWAQGAPSVVLSNVVDGAYYNAPVFPVYAIADLTLDTSSVRATLDGSPFVSGSTVSAEGRHALVVSAANAAGHTASAQAAFTIDTTPPQISFSLADGAALRSTSPVSVQVTVSDLNPGTSSFFLNNLLLGTMVPYKSGAPITLNGQYVLNASATDLAGNVSTASVAFSLENAPPAPANLSVSIQNDARLSWTSPEPDVVAYRVYRDGARVSASLYNGTFFEDTSFTPGGHVYEVSAIDAAGVEGPRARATIPAVSLTLPALTLTRGYFDALQPTLLNSSTSTLAVGPAVLTLIDATGAAVASATGAATTAGAGQAAVLPSVLAVPAGLSATSLLRASVALQTDPGASLIIGGDFVFSAQDPVQPLLEVFPGALVAGTLSSVQVRLYNRGTAPMDVITGQVSGATVVPTSGVQVQLQTTGGTLLASGGLAQADNGAAVAAAGGRQVEFVTIPPGQSVLFDPVQVLVPNTAASSLSVAAIVSSPTYSLAGVAIPGPRSFASSLVQGTVAQIPYTATSAADRAVYDQGSTVTISGRAVDAAGAPAPFVPVLVAVMSNGYTRALNAVTDSSGNYAAYYTPAPNEAGLYTTFAAAPQVVARGSQSTFAIEGFGFQSSGVQATLAQNGAYSFTLGLSNTGATPVAGLSVSTSLVSGGGVTLTWDPSTLPATLAPGAQASLALTLAAAPTSSSSTLTLAVADSRGFSRSLPIAANVAPAQAIPVVTPSSLSLGMLGGDVRSVTLTLQNKGFDAWRGVTVNAPALSWATVLGSTGAVGDIPPGGNASVILQFAPPASLPNGTYVPSPLLQITSLNVPAVGVQAGVAVTSSRQGSVLAGVINADKPKSLTGQGVPVPGAKVTLVSLDVSGLTFAAAADQNGLAAFGQIPSGNYQWRAEAQGFQTQSGTLVVEPGLTNQLQAVLATAVVSYQWTVVPTVIQDQYQIALTLQYRTDVPAPVIVVDQPSANYNINIGQTAFGQFTVTNKGLVSVQNFRISTGSVDGLAVDLPFTVIPELKPGQSVVVPYAVTFVHASLLCKLLQMLFGGSYTCAYGTTQSVSGFLQNVVAGLCPADSGGAAGTTSTVSLNSGGGAGGASDGLGLGAAGPAQCLYCDSQGNLVPAKGSSKAPGPRTPDKKTTTGDNTGCDKHGKCSGVGHGSPAMLISPTYDSLGMADGPFGFGWSASYFESIAFGGPDGITALHLGDGSSLGFFGQSLRALTASLSGTSISGGSGGSAGSGSAVFSVSGPMVQVPDCVGGNAVVSFVPPPGIHDSLAPATQAPAGASSPSLSMNCDGTPTGLTYTRQDGTSIAFSLFSSVPLTPGTSVYLPTLLTDRNGSAVTYARDSLGRLTKLTDVHGRFVTFAYGADNRVAAVADSAGRQVFYAYDSTGNLTSIADANGDVTRYAYDGSHNLTQIAYPNGGVRTFAYDVSHRATSEADDAGADAFNYVFSSATAAGSTKVVDGLGRSALHAWTDYSGTRRLTGLTDPAQNVWLANYTSDAMMSDLTDPLGRKTSFAYDGRGNMTALTNAAGGAWQTAYGPFSLPTAVIDPNGNKTVLTYDGSGDLVQAQDAAGNSTLFGYDKQGHVTGVKDALGDATSIAYNGNGAPVSLTDPLGRTVAMGRDALSRMTSFTDPAGNQTAFAYDAEDNVTQVKDALNNVTSFAYQPGRLGRLPASVTDANNHKTAMSYDVTGRLTSVVNALNQSASVGYDVMSRVQTVTNRNGRSFAFAYDNLDRLTKLTAAEGSIDLSYDAVGNLTSASSYNGSSLGMAYDALNRVTSVAETLPGGYTASLGYAYDANGNRTQMTTPWGTFRYAYDSLNRVTSIANPFGQAVTFQYDALSRRTKMTYPNGVVTTYAYDAAGQLTQIVAQRSSDHSAVAFESYAYDANGNRVSATDLTGTHTYAYDKLNRLTSAGHPAASGLPILNETFSYDAVGNRLADAAITGYQYDAANRLTQNSSFTYTYDANGNMTSRTDRGTGERTAFVYNSSNQLVEVDGSTYTIATYKYDVVGRRIEKSTGGTATRYLYDGQNIVAVIDSNNNLLQLFTQGPGIDAPLIMRQAGQDYFYHADAVGSVVSLTANNGSITETVEYQSYGREAVRDASGNLGAISNAHNPFLYTAREFDSEARMYYLRARTYDPDAGRFLQEDPIRGINQYMYVADNPQILRDPSGDDPAIVGAVAVGVVAIVGATVGAEVAAAVALGAAIGATANVVITLATANGPVTAAQIEAAAINGAIAGGVAAVALPLATAAGLTGGTALLGSAAISSLGSTAGQEAANLRDPNHAGSLGDAATWGFIGGFMGNFFGGRSPSSFAQMNVPGIGRGGDRFGSYLASTLVGTLPTIAGSECPNSR